MRPAETRASILTTAHEKRSPAGPSGAGRGSRRKKSRFLYNALVFCITVPTVMACAFWVFGFHFYSIVSNSMSPTLLAIEGEWKDKLLCSLVTFRMRAPRRWETVVFHTPSAANIAAVGDGVRLPLEHEMTVKRVVGLPGEEMAIRNGDIWARPAAGGMHILQAKPDKVQRSLWIPVYSEDFSLAGEREFLHFWRREGDGAVEAAGREDERHLRFRPGEEPLRFRYLPGVRTGKGGRETALLPGVPDRYLLPQKLWFKCENENCGETFGAWHEEAQVQARCPSCGRFLFEESVQAYAYSSGLAAVGPNSATGMQDGEPTAFRTSPYRMVTDLRFQAAVMLSSPADVFTVILHENEGGDSLALSPGRLTLNDRALSAGARIETGKWFAVEFYRADGALRLFVEKKEIVLPQTRVRAFPEHNEENVASGASFSVAGNGVRIGKVELARDIHYASGFDNPFKPQFNTMGPDGKVTLSPGHFFPLGDNTELSLDARAWGPVPVSLLRGNVIAITQPVERRRLVPVPRE